MISIQRLPHTPAHRIVALLSLVLFLAGIVPLGEAFTGAAGSEKDDCCTVADGPQIAAATGDNVDDGCCDAHCRGCFLKCCNGTRTLSPEIQTVAPTPACERVFLIAAQAGAVSHLRTIDHPPRA